MYTTQPARHDFASFRVDVHPERDAARVVPVGELDLATSGAVEAKLHELRDAGFRELVLDLRRLTLLDSAAVALIVEEDLWARSNGHGFSLIGGPPAIERVLQSCGLRGRLPFRPV